MSEYPGSVDCFVDASRVWTDQNDHAAIVLHCTASADPNQTDIQLGNYFQTNAARVSTHYGIDRTGAIAQYVLEKDGSAGNGILDPGHDPFWDQYADNPNWHSLSVECENDVHNSLPLTDPQKQTLFSLVKYWVDKYNIPQSNIKGHFTLEPVQRHDCPGAQFPWQELWNYLNGGKTMPTIPQGWTDDGTTLRAPDGTPVVLGFRDHVLNGNWDPANIPLEAEHHDLVVEQSNASLGAGQSQMFRWKRLEYTSKQGIVEGWLGQELLWYQKQYQAMLKQVADLQQQLTTLQAQNGQIKTLLNASNIAKINTLAAQIVGLSQVQ